MKRRNFLTLAAAPVLSACGGGGEQDDEPVRSARRLSAAAIVNVMMWGDSTEAGARLPSGSSPSAEAQKVLTRWGHDFDVRHEAIGGQPAHHLLVGRHPKYPGIGFADFPTLAWADIGGLRYGINELRTEQTQAMFRDTLQEEVDIARAARKVLILSTPSPADPAIIRPALVEYIEASAETVRAVFRANRDMAVLCDQNAYAKAAGIVTWKLDGLHPNDDANVLEGRRLAHSVLRANELRLGVTT